MLGKLIHHDFKATAKLFVILFLFIILLTPVTKLSMNFLLDLDKHRFFGEVIEIPHMYRDFLEEIAHMVLLSYYASLLIFAAATFFILILHFYRSMVTRQAYLTHTLPVTSGQLIASKTIVSVIWTVLAILVALLSVFILAASKDSLEEIQKELLPFINRIEFPKHTGYVILAFIEGLLLLLASITLSYAKVFFAISIGQSFKNYKVLASVGIYYALNIASRFLNGIGLFFSSILIGLGLEINPVHLTLYVAMPLLILITSGICAGFLLICSHMFKNHLNLQ